jgi:peptidoglycan/LPS O-acetylase OafA/YrhL
MTEPIESPRLGYRPELDGVRGLAVLAIFGYHIAFMVPWLHRVFQGGFLSVDVFFVLSGMLITEILVNDHERRGTARLGSFYDRRARRLLPALISFVGLTIAYYSLVHDDGHRIIKGYGAVVAYVAYGHVVAPFPPGVSQVWTLVVEWLFYLVWPLLLTLLLRRNLSRRTIAWVAVTLAVASGIARAVLFHHNGNTNLSYFSAGLRFEDLLTGCAIGLFGARPQAPSWLRTVGLVFIVVATSRANIAQSWVYYAAMPLTAAATATIVQPRTRAWWFDRVLTAPFVVWVGTVSYSFYLWSVFSVSEVGHTLGSWPLPLRAGFATALSFGLAAASYYFIEEPFRVKSRRAPATAASATT